MFACMHTVTHSSIHVYTQSCRMHTRHGDKPSNKPAYIHACIRTQTDMNAVRHTCILTDRPSYLHANTQIYMRTHMQTYIHVNMHAYRQTYTHANSTHNHV